MAGPKPPAKVRSGQLAGTTVEVWSEADEARATGFFQILDERGHADAALVPRLPAADFLRMYASMLQSRLLDELLVPMQRQGRIGPYLEARGQEAGVVAAAHALRRQDVLFPALRESAAALHRGLPLRAYLAQVFGNGNDRGRGRQMPCHPGSRSVRHVTGSSSVAAQMPHATGLAWAARIRGEKVVALGFVDDGGASEDDFQSALNFAAVFKAPVVFVCQNSRAERRASLAADHRTGTAVTSQTASRSIAMTGLSLGVPSLRVDGNDVLGLYVTINDAVARARAGGGPSFVEAVTHRMGASADEPDRHRDPAAIEAWEGKDPLLRFAAWLDAQKLLSRDAQAATRQRIEAEIREAIAAEEAAAPPPVESMFDDVLARPSWVIEEQRAEHLRVRRRQR
jgi:pyruvate dehydrogenase E1 component alpha subunit/2-oxoisovalerate dehydrogenase E1 component alpha subunit